MSFDREISSWIRDQKKSFAQEPIIQDFDIGFGVAGSMRS
jgi:hypothetical protein